MSEISEALKIAPQTATVAMLNRIIAPKNASESSSPSSSMYAREMSTIKTAGAILLNGIGVRSSAVVSNRTTMPTKRLAASKAFGQTRMNYSLKIAKYRNSASSKAEKIL